MARSIRDYVSEGTSITYGQLKARFGDPKQIAGSYVSELETDEMLGHLKTSRKIANAFVVAAGVALALWAGCIALCYMNYHSDINGYAIVEVTELERTTIDKGE